MWDPEPQCVSRGPAVLASPSIHRLQTGRKGRCSSSLPTERQAGLSPGSSPSHTGPGVSPSPLLSRDGWGSQPGRSLALAFSGLSVSEDSCPRPQLPSGKVAVLSAKASQSPLLPPWSFLPGPHQAPPYSVSLRPGCRRSPGDFSQWTILGEMKVRHSPTSQKPRGACHWDEKLQTSQAPMTGSCYLSNHFPALPSLTLFQPRYPRPSPRLPLILFPLHLWPGWPLPGSPSTSSSLISLTPWLIHVAHSDPPPTPAHPT